MQENLWIDIYRAENSLIYYFFSYITKCYPIQMAFTFALFVYMNSATSLKLNYESSATIYECTPATCHSLYIYK